MHLHSKRGALMSYSADIATLTAFAYRAVEATSLPMHHSIPTKHALRKYILKNGYLSALPPLIPCHSIYIM